MFFFIRYFNARLLFKSSLDYSYSSINANLFNAIYARLLYKPSIQGYFIRLLFKDTLQVYIKGYYAKLLCKRQGYYARLLYKAIMQGP